MQRIHVVTDSTADLNPETARLLGISVIPLRVYFDQEEYEDRVTLGADAFFARLRTQPSTFPQTLPPGVTDFETAYRSLAQSTDAILSIHISARLSGTYANALQARDLCAMRDPCRIIVIDSQLASMGLGFIAMEAARAGQAGYSLEQVARLARGMLPQTHILFFVDTVEYLERGGRIGKLQALVSTLTNVKPLLRLDDGEIVLMEKVRTRAKALERLYEFVAEFPHVERLGIVHSTTANEASNLAKRLAGAVPADRVVITRYGPGLAAHLGPGAVGVVVYEGKEERP